MNWINFHRELMSMCCICKNRSQYGNQNTFCLNWNPTLLQYYIFHTNNQTIFHLGSHVNCSKTNHKLFYKLVYSELSKSEQTIQTIQWQFKNSQSPKTNDLLACQSLTLAFDAVTIWCNHGSYDKKLCCAYVV